MRLINSVLVLSLFASFLGTAQVNKKMTIKDDIENSSSLLAECPLSRSWNADDSSIRPSRIREGYILSNILSHVGLPINLSLNSADNKGISWNNENQSILYDPLVMDSLDNGLGTHWFSTFFIAHAVGHLLIDYENKNNLLKEWQVMYFCGFILEKLGISKAEAVGVIDLLKKKYPRLEYLEIEDKFFHGMDNSFKQEEQVATPIIETSDYLDEVGAIFDFSNPNPWNYKVDSTLVQFVDELGDPKSFEISSDFHEIVIRQTFNNLFEQFVYFDFIGEDSSDISLPIQCCNNVYARTFRFDALSDVEATWQDELLKIGRKLSVKFLYDRTTDQLYFLIIRTVHDFENSTVIFEFSPSDCFNHLELAPDTTFNKLVSMSENIELVKIKSFNEELGYVEYEPFDNLSNDIKKGLLLRSYFCNLSLINYWKLNWKLDMFKVGSIRQVEQVIDTKTKKRYLVTIKPYVK